MALNRFLGGAHMPLQPLFAQLTYISILLLTACAPAAATPTFLPVTPTRAQALTSTPPIQANVEIIGDPELVFDWETQHCAEPNAPDLPVRPFRDASGMININLSAPTNYRLIGPDLDHLEVDCNPTLISDFDPDPAHFNYSEWIGATYTLDGQNVYAIVHDEYYGDLGSNWDSQRDFSSEQGQKGWSYNAWTGASYQAMHYDAANSHWQGPTTYCRIFNWGVHPDGYCEPARTWNSPEDSTMLVHGSVSGAAQNGGDGVIAAIYLNDQMLWSQSIDSNDAEIYPFALQVDMVQGDTLTFRVNQRSSADFDSTQFQVKIDRGSNPCLSGQRERCFYAGLTYAVSTDGGKTFSQPGPPDNQIAAPPSAYDADAGSFAMWQPSNIVHNPDDGYYYALVARIYAPYNQGGHVNAACVMRTQTLDDPASWRAWDGEGFNLPLSNSSSEAEGTPCTIVERLGLTYGLTYNTYLQAFIATGQAFGIVPRSGFYYVTSTDLVHWSQPYLLMATDLVQTTDGPFLAYPALVDPDSPSMSFDVTGQDPYLYFSSFQAPSLSHVDLLRVRIHFER
jgi:hypothetical protein